MLKSLFGSRQEYTAIAQNKKNDTSPENIEMTNGEQGSMKFVINQNRKEKIQENLNFIKNNINKKIFEEMDSPEKIIGKFSSKDTNFIKLCVRLTMSDILYPDENDIKIIIQECIDDFNKKFPSEIVSTLDKYFTENYYSSLKKDINIIMKFTLL